MELRTCPVHKEIVVKDLVKKL